MAKRSPRSRDAALSASSSRLFARLTREYSITDAGGLEILRSGLRALDQATAAEGTIAAEGQTVKDRFGQTRMHPLLPAARDFRAMWLASLKALNLAVGDPPKVGRPEQ